MRIKLTFISALILLAAALIPANQSADAGPLSRVAPFFFAAQTSIWDASATWNPTTGTEKNVDITLSGSDLVATNATTANWRSVRATVGKTLSVTSAFEVTVTDEGAAANRWAVGLSSGVVDCSSTGLVLVGFSEVSGAGYSTNGNSLQNFAGAAYGATFTTGDVIGVKLHTSGDVEFFKNGVSQGVAYTLPAGTYYPMWSGNDQGANPIVTANFGATPFVYNY